MTKTVLFVPGFRESIDSRDYKAVISAIERHGYKVTFVPIQWKRTTLPSWAEELRSVYNKHKPEETILAGFSYGSMTALDVATERNPSELWLFSLSPYYADDITEMKPAWLKEIAKMRADFFRRYEFAPLAEKVRCKTTLFVGEKEVNKYPIIGSRSEKASKTIKNSTLIIIPATDHDVADPRYISAIESYISGGHYR